MITTARSTDLSTIYSILQGQRPLVHDVVVPSKLVKMSVIDGQPVLTIPGHAEITLDGVTEVSQPATLGMHSSGQLAERTGIPVKYFRRMGAEKPELLATNVNAWLADDKRTVQLRTFRAAPPRDGNDEQGMGFVRAVVSDRFFTFDNLDVLMSVLEGADDAGVRLEVKSADLTDTNLHVRFFAPEITVDIADLVSDYTHGGNHGSKYPLLYAGLALRNSEVGAGMFDLRSHVTVQVCTNGLTRDEGISRTHLGERLDEGVVEFSEETKRKQLELIKLKTRDTVKSLVSVEHLTKVRADMAAAKSIVIANPTETIKVVAQKFAYTEAQADALLNRFISGRDFTVLGVGQAVTSLAQEADDGDTQSAAERDVWSVMSEARKAVLATA